MRQNDSSSVTQDISNDYVQTVFIEMVKAVQRKIKLPRAAPVLLCDNSSSHLSEDILRRLARDNLRMIKLLPHISNFFQPLDLPSRGVFNQKKGMVVLEHPMGSQACQITKALHILELAAISRNNRAALRSAVLVVNLQVVPPEEGDQEFAHFGFINRDLPHVFPQHLVGWRGDFRSLPRARQLQ
jgi:hypothetical protein